MRTKVIITVDTEPSIAGAFANPKRNKPRIHEPIWGKVGGKSQGLGFIIDTLVRNQLCATFFVETIHQSYFSKELMGDYVDRLCAAKQDIQLHLHPCWLSFKKDFEGGNKPHTDQCGGLSDERLATLIEEGSNCIRDWCGSAPRSLRTGNFSVSANVYRAMKLTGLTISSNICIAVAPPAEATADQWGDPLSLAGGIHFLYGIYELPVTCFKDRSLLRPGKFRPLQITACSFEEQRAHLTALHEAGATVGVIVTHPFEFLCWSGASFRNLRANRLVQRRFENLCSFLAKNADKFEVVPIGRISDEELKIETAIRLDGNAISATCRSLENFINDRLPLGVHS